MKWKAGSLSCLFNLLFTCGCAGSSLLHASFSLVERSRGCSLAAVRGLLIVVALLVAKHGLWGTWASGVAGRELSSCGSQALGHRLSSCST